MENKAMSDITTFSDEYFENKGDISNDERLCICIGEPDQEFHEVHVFDVSVEEFENFIQHYNREDGYPAVQLVRKFGNVAEFVEDVRNHSLYGDEDESDESICSDDWNFEVYTQTPSYPYQKNVIACYNGS
jgi:hypothetical protein